MSANATVRIAVDAMSGDDGVDTATGGAVLALESDPALELSLVGDGESLQAALAGVPPALRERIHSISAPGVLPMDVSTAGALRCGAGSSMQRSLEQVVAGEAAAAVSAGNTGALMALSRQVLGMLPGLDRPALMAAIPTASGEVWMLDLGANVGVDARRLHEFALLGDIAVGVMTGRRPRVGLLNIGREPGKGPDVVREAARLIDDDGALDYAGFIEANQVFSGRVDLVVCDGFAGNILLKSAEGMTSLLLAEIERSLGRGLAGMLARRRLRRLGDRLDPARHNGAPLLGIRGTVIKSHGGACRRGVAAAIALAARQARRDLIPELENRLWASD